MREQTQWLRIPPEELERKRIFHGDLGGRFAYFRCARVLPEGAEGVLVLPSGREIPFTGEILYNE